MEKRTNNTCGCGEGVDKTVPLPKNFTAKKCSGHFTVEDQEDPVQAGLDVIFKPLEKCKNCSGGETKVIINKDGTITLSGNNIVLQI